MALKVQANGSSTSIIELGMSGEQKNKFTLPIKKAALIDALKTLLADSEMRDFVVGAVNLDRMRDGIRVASGNGNFVLAYAQIYPIILGDV